MQNMYHSHYLTSLHIAYLLSTPSKIFHSFQMNKSSRPTLESRLQFPPTLIIPENHFKFWFGKNRLAPLTMVIKEGNKQIPPIQMLSRCLNQDMQYLVDTVLCDWSLARLGLETIIQVYDPLKPPARTWGQSQPMVWRLLLNNFSVFLLQSNLWPQSASPQSGRTLDASVLLRNLSPLSKLSSARWFVISLYSRWMCPGNMFLKDCPDVQS